jgi:hypothetical protein
VAEVHDAVRYVPDIEGGFIVALEESSRTRIALPTALKVQVDRIADNRDYFTIAEGVLRGKTASIKHQENGESRLYSKNPHLEPVQLEYSLSKKTVRLKNKSKTYQAIVDPENPLLKGLYDLEIPDAPHRGGSAYPEARYGRTWFRIGHSGDRYLHTGRVSAGCVTVQEQSRWDELYLSLIAARKGDHVSIGTLQVVD